MSAIIGLMIGGAVWYGIAYLVSKNNQTNKAIKQHGTAACLDDEEILSDIKKKATHAGCTSLYIFLGLNFIIFLIAVCS